MERDAASAEALVGGIEAAQVQMTIAQVPAYRPFNVSAELLVITIYLAKNTLV